jgi:hypothetical protein
MPDPTPDLNNSNALPFSDGFPVNQPGREGSPFMTAISSFIARPDAPPWVFPQVIVNRRRDYSNSALSHPRGISAEILQPTVLQTPKFKTLQPSKRSSTTSSTLEWSNTTPGPQSVQPLAVDKQEVKLPPRSGCRNGPLPPEVAKQARIMRKKGACWPCRLVKFKVIASIYVLLRLHLIKCSAHSMILVSGVRNSQNPNLDLLRLHLHPIIYSAIACR